VKLDFVKMKRIGSLLCILFSASLVARADTTNAPLEIHLDSPLDYQIFQRATREQGELIISGTILPEMKDALPLDTLQARLTGKSFTGDVLLDKWQKLPFDPRAAAFRGELAVPAGGWYRLEVRALQQKAPLFTNAVEHVGVGEIFVIAGQSNSANYGEKKNRTETGLVAAYNGTNWQLAADPEPGAGGKKGSFMPLFGDAMVEEFHVPVGLVPMGIGSTSVREWLPAGIPFTQLPSVTRNVVTVGPGQWEAAGKIYDTFASRMKRLGPNGFRAVLWHQGESDANQANSQNTLPGADYRKYLEQIISDSRRDIGWDAPWFVAQVSYHNPDDTGTPDIPAAQRAVCDDGFAFLGPDTDVLTGQMREKNGMGIHLSAEGLKAHARLWVQKIAPWLERRLDEPANP
jgi:Carbohydrate esterase, sialic acid-specific acetylesterase